MTNVLSMFRFRRWDSEKKTKVFIKTLNAVFAVFFGLAVFAVYQASTYDVTLGVIVGVILLMVLIAFDLVNRASIYMSKDRRNFLQYKSNFDSQAEASRRIAVNELTQVRIELDEVSKELSECIDMHAKYTDSVRDKVEMLNTLINKKRRGKKMRLPKDVKACLNAINRTVK